MAEDNSSMLAGNAAIATQAAKGIFDFADSIIKNRAAAKIYKNNKRPVYNRPGEIDDVYYSTLSELQNSDQEAFGSQSLDRGLATSIDALMKTGSGFDFGTVYNTYGNQLRGLTQQLQADRAAKLGAYYNAAYNLGKAKDTEFQYNKDAPFKDAMQQAAALKQQGAQAQASGFTNLSGAFSNYATSRLKSNVPENQGGGFYDLPNNQRDAAMPIGGVGQEMGLSPNRNRFNFADFNIFDSTM